MDSDHRRQSRQIYSLLHLATLEPLQKCEHIINVSLFDCKYFLIFFQNFLICFITH